MVVVGRSLRKRGPFLLFEVSSQVFMFVRPSRTLRDHPSPGLLGTCFCTSTGLISKHLSGVPGRFV